MPLLQVVTVPPTGPAPAVPDSAAVGVGAAETLGEEVEETVCVGVEEKDSRVVGEAVGREVSVMAAGEGVRDPVPQAVAVRVTPPAPSARPPAVREGVGDTAGEAVPLAPPTGGDAVAPALALTPTVSVALGVRLAPTMLLDVGAAEAVPAPPEEAVGVPVLLTLCSALAVDAGEVEGGAEALGVPLAAAQGVGAGEVEMESVPVGHIVAVGVESWEGEGAGEVEGLSVPELHTVGVVERVVVALAMAERVAAALVVAAGVGVGAAGVPEGERVGVGVPPVGETLGVPGPRASPMGPTPPQDELGVREAVAHSLRVMRAEAVMGVALVQGQEELEGVPATPWAPTGPPLSVTL